MSYYVVVDWFVYWKCLIYDLVGWICDEIDFGLFSHFYFELEEIKHLIGFEAYREISLGVFRTVVLPWLIIINNNKRLFAKALRNKNSKWWNWSIAMLLIAAGISVRKTASATVKHVHANVNAAMLVEQIIAKK